MDSLRNGFFASRQLCLYILCCFLFCLVLVNKFEALCGQFVVCEPKVFLPIFFEAYSYTIN